MSPSGHEDIDTHNGFSSALDWHAIDMTLEDFTFSSALYLSGKTETWWGRGTHESGVKMTATTSTMQD